RIERMAQHLRTLIGSALSEPGRAVDRLNLLPEAEQERVLVEFNSTAASYPETATIVDLFEEQVEITPDAFAVRFDDRRLTYRQLNSRANALARRLREEFHVAPNDLIGVVLDRSERMITTLLAVLKAGGAYIPIDPAYPVERIRFIIEDSGCQLVLTENNRYLESLRLAAFGRKYTLLDIDTIHHEEETNLQPGASPEHAAYVIYTSGSTGQPKGCIITHRNVVRLMKNALFRFDFGPQDVWVSAHSFSFDFSVWEMYGALLYGGQVVVARREEARDAAAFRDLIHRCGVTVLNQTPAAFYNLIEVERSQPSPDLGRHLRYVIFGGDRLEPAHLRPWAERYPLEEIRLVNMYGITETTVHVSYGPITREHVFSGEKCSPIGVPLPETRVYICDEKMNPQPIGVPGELYIGGSGVCRGYLNRPELSAARFLPSPFRKDERLYRTGDLGRWRSDGTLEYIGRNDSQVQIRGFRVELGEIQSVLTAHALVRDAAVIVSQLAGGAAGDASGADQRLVAYLIPKSPGQLPVTELRAYAKEKLPDYMVPSHFVQLDSFPLTANGKIDYRALPAPEGTREELGGDYVAPGDETERQIAEIWRQTLGVERVGLNDNFFDIGGHSLLLIQVHRRLREACHAELPLVELFRYPTVRTLAEYLNSITTRRREQPPFEQPAPADQPAPPEEPAMEAPAPFDQPSPVQVANTGRLSPPVLDQEAPDQPAPEPFGPDRQEEEEEAEPEYSLPVMVINTMPLSLPQSAQSAPDHIASVQSAPAQPAPEREGREEIAIVGMAGRFPGAPDLAAFWRNLCRGIESVVSLSDKELRAAGVPEELIANPRYVKTKPVLDGVADFDAEFFGISPREAEVMDPQHRLFLECAWEALENAGYDSATYSGRIGVYAGASLNSYLLNNLYPNRHLLESLGVYPVLIGNDRDFIATRVSYKLNLKGPSINLSTACSTSLVAVQQACLSLLSRQSDMVLAGGVSIKVPQHEGYLYDEGGILSPDGHCRAFDAHARGTVGGSGVGIVVLKRLTDALQDGDSILAVIKGAALGNDGSDKIGYAAPSVKGQAAVIAEAYAQAGVRQETISYVEAHGTGTSLGDPIEIAALTEAFGSPERGFCAIGSVKTNIGHLDAAAGIAGLIKTVLALQHQQIPPSLNYEHPNPGINFSDSPFYVNTKLSPWRAPDAPRRAGVSSFGLGGTNVHLVLEEFTAPPSSGPSRPFQILTLSGRTPSALETATRRLAEHFDQQPEIDLADAAFTLGVGRRDFEHRRVAICRGAAEAASLLRENDPRRILSGVSAKNERRVAFLFPGGGAQYADMAVGLYLDEPVFREQIDLCAELLRPHLNIDLRRIMYTSQQNQPEQAADNLLKPSLGLPALFATEYALAQLWMAWGIRPQVMIGHSLGEYAAACLAGVISLEDALALVALRGRLFEELPEGRMLSIPLSEHELRPYLDRQFSIAAINHPNACVVSGAAASIEQLEAALAETQIESRRLHISVAAHSTLVEPILDRFRDFISRIELRPPQIPFL
ncbi:MAG TPA: amino acid adenylation domain-containing protein, partial [Blastocatellia bacterium]|nr:amino acid adenylation domain-containing protein [Blastocatellia bacterium]